MLGHWDTRTVEVPEREVERGAAGVVPEKPVDHLDLKSQFGHNIAKSTPVSTTRL